MIITERGKLKAQMAATIMAGMRHGEPNPDGYAAMSLSDAEVIIQAVESEEANQAQEKPPAATKERNALFEIRGLTHSRDFVPSDILTMIRTWANRGLGQEVE